MTAPRLTFFTEIDAGAYQDLLTPDVLADLRALKAHISMGILDLSPERAQVVRMLNQQGIPVIAWLLLPKEQGYYFNLDNASQASAFYNKFQAWTQENQLKWEGIGLDIEPDIRDLESLKMSWWPALRKMLRRAFSTSRLKNARKSYRLLVDRIQADGYKVESYQFPVITDERKIKSTTLQRVFGLVDVPVDKEVLMLYSTFFGRMQTPNGEPVGIGYLWNYASEAEAIGVGSTGGGMGLEPGADQPLTWDDIARDLRLAWYWSNDLYIFSLEGCVRQGYLRQLRSMVWDQPILSPDQADKRILAWRNTLQTALWLSHNGLFLLAGFTGTMIAWQATRSYLKHRRSNKLSLPGGE